MAVKEEGLQSSTCCHQSHLSVPFSQSHLDLSLSDIFLFSFPGSIPQACPPFYSYLQQISFSSPTISHHFSCPEVAITLPTFTWYCPI